MIGTRVFVTTVRAPGSYLVAFSTRTGRRLWARKLCSMSWRAPTWTGRHVVVGDYCGVVRAYRLWAVAYGRGSRRLDLRGDELPERVGASTKRARLYKLSARTGRVRWVASTGQGEGYGECAVGRTRVYCTNLDGTVRSFTVEAAASSGSASLASASTARPCSRAGWFGSRSTIPGRSWPWALVLDLSSGGDRGEYDPAVASGTTVYLVGHTSVAAFKEA